MTKMATPDGPPAAYEGCIKNAQKGQGKGKGKGNSQTAWKGKNSWARPWFSASGQTPGKSGREKGKGKGKGKSKGKGKGQAFKKGKANWPTWNPPKGGKKGGKGSKGKGKKGKGKGNHGGGKKK